MATSQLEIQQLSIMIRNNNKKKHDASNRLHNYNYRNALYQGQINSSDGSRQGHGIVYITDSHRLIATNHFKNNKLYGPCFFFRGHAEYLYGYWANNKPHGMAIFRLNQVLIITEYKQGELPQGYKIIYILQRYNIGLIVEVDAQGEWSVFEQRDILCREHIEQLIKQCQFASEPIPYLLIKYLNNHMVAQNSAGIRLRLLSNMYYRYGCDRGLAIIFDDQYKIISAGVHNKSSLVSFGVKFNGKDLGNTVEQGIFDGQHTYVFDQGNRPIHKIGQLYCRKHLAEVNFRNQIYKDPSESYFEFHFNVLESDTIRSVFRNLVLTSVDNYSFQNIIDGQPRPQEHTPSQRKQFPQFEMATFKQTTDRMPSQRIHTKRDGPSQEQIKQLLHQNTHKNLDTFYFEKLPEKSRLNILKQEVYTSVNHKQSRQREEQQRSKRKVGIISMSPVNLNLNKVQNFPKKQREGQDIKKRDIYINILPEIQDKPNTTPNNLERHLNIKLNSSLESSSRNHSQRKKIFEQNSNIRKDYTPEASPSPSPFKTKVRSRIFSQTPDRSQGKSSRRIFANTVTPQKKPPVFVREQRIDSRRVQQERNIEPTESFHRQFNASMDKKSQNQSFIRTYPITNERHSAPLNHEIYHNSKHQEEYQERNVEDQYVLVKHDPQEKSAYRAQTSSRQIKEESKNVQLFQRQKKHEMKTSVKKDERRQIKDFSRKQRTQKKGHIEIKDNRDNRTIKSDIKSISSKNDHRQSGKKSNIVYRDGRNKLPEQMIQFEPIKVDNSPYVKNYKQLSYNPSGTSLQKDQSKKSIESSLPLKREKMRNYMNSSPYEFDEIQKLGQFKRKVNYF